MTLAELVNQQEELEKKVSQRLIDVEDIRSALFEENCENTGKTLKIAIENAHKIKQVEIDLGNLEIMDISRKEQLKSNIQICHAKISKY